MSGDGGMHALSHLVGDATKRVNGERPLLRSMVLNASPGRGGRFRRSGEIAIDDDGIRG